MPTPEETDQLRALAAQLARPSGEAGMRVAENMNAANARLAERAIAALDVQPGQQVVEIGPANGQLSVGLVQRLGKSGRYTAIELAPDMAQECAARLGAIDAAPVQVLNLDCRLAELPAASVDGIFGTNFVYFLDELEPFLRRAASWLKPGGRLVIGIRSKTSMRRLPFTPYGFRLRESAEIAAALADCGFEDICDRYYDDEGEHRIGDLTVRVDAHIISARKPA
jgi:cyclopropane fatty-acyl-phospholipid synthase-like methyltransferase